jgi:transposase InsO family protein
MMLDESLFLWNKDSNKRLYIEVDACNEGWGACAYQYAEPKPPDVEDEGRYMLMSKLPKRVVEWVSKAWTEFEKELPVFYREALARLLCLEHFRNLIETQSLDAGTTVYTDHAPSTYVGSLSNKGRLSTWRIHETSDLTGIVQTLYKAGQYLGPGPYGGLADPLSRMPRGEQFHRLELPALLTELLQRLPDSIRNAHNIRVTAEKDTHLATRIVQRWRVPKNPISNVRSDNKEDFDFLIAAPFAEKVTHKVAQLIRERKKFAVLIAVDLLPQIKVTKAKENDKVVEQALLSMPTILIAPLALVWLVNHPDYQLPKQGHVVLYGTNDRVLTEASTENGSTGSDVEMTEKPDHPENNLFPSSNSDWSKQLFSENSRDDWSRAVVDGIDRLCCDGGLRDPEGSRTLVATTRSRARAPAETPTEVGVVAEVETPLASVSSDVPQRAAKVRTKACVRGKEASEVATFRGSPPPDPHDKWIGQQDPTEIPNGGRLLDSPSGFPDGLLVIEDDQRRQRIIVPLEQRERLIKQEHLSLLHIGPERVARALTKRYYWHKMNDLVKRIVTSCHDCQVSRMRLQRLSLEFAEADANQLPLPRQRYGIDFHGHAKGEILVAIDLVTREVCLWLLPNRKQENVSRALLSGLVFVKGVPLEFRSDNAPELMSGLVAAMNHYLGVEQITTGGYNPRGNAIVERFMHTLGHMLRIASNEEYNNLKDYLQCIAFAHNCTYSSVIECTPFEAGHGLRARTVAEARMALPKLQLLEEDSEDSPATQAWDKSLPKKVLELAARMAAIAQAHSEWHRRMTSEKLNQANRPFDDSQLQVGMRVYFYKPPSQQEVAAKGRKAKHLAHYHGPATVTVSRKRQLELRYEGKTFNRDISLVIPAKDFTDLEVDSFDPVVTEAVSPPSRHVVGELPKEGELVVIKDSTTEGWFLSEVLRVLPNLVEVRYFTTPTPALENYEHCSVQKRSERLSEICFRRTWHVRFGKHVGRATYKPPYPNNEDLQVWKGAINNSDLDSMLLLRNVRIDAEGKLDEASLRLAAQLPISHEKLDTIEDEIEGSSLTRQTPNLFTSSREILCSCVNCSNLLSRDYVVAQRKLTEQSTATSQSSND